jgi:hypothetical protein
MPSSTLSSKSPALFYTKLLIAICCVLILVFEISSAYLLKHHSETYQRVSQQWADAVNVRPAMPGEPIPVLMVGNSLLMEGIDEKRLQDLTSTQVRVHPVLLEATGYYDWYYGLRRLFREGSRPQVVVLGVGVNSFLANSIRHDYAPLMLFDTRDVLGAASDLNLDRTATSDLLLAHASAFWDARSVLRTQILRHTVPHCRELFMLLRPLPAIPPIPVFEATADLRLKRLRDLCQSYGARLVLLLPPAPYSADAIQRMKFSARQVNVETIVPIDPAALSVKYYQPDEIHLNSEGAALFTSAFAASLRQRLDQPPTASSE